MSALARLSTAIPEDALLLIFRFLPCRDILHISQTCKFLRKVVSAKHLWLDILLERDVLSEYIPLPTSLRSLDSLSNLQTRSLVVHALKLHQAVAKNSWPCRPLLVSFHQPRQVTWVRLVRANWLLVASSDLSCSSISLFSVTSIIRGDHPSPIAQAFLDAAVANGEVDFDHDGSIIIALELRGLTSAFEVLSLNDDGREVVFVRRARFTDVAHIRALSGALIGYAFHEDSSLPSVLNWKTGETSHLDDLPGVRGSAVAMAIDGDLVAVLSPAQLAIARLTNETNPQRYTTLTTFALPRPFGFARLVFAPTVSILGHQLPPMRCLHVCMTFYKEVCVYSIPLESAVLHNDLQGHKAFSYDVTNNSGATAAKNLVVSYAALPSTEPMYLVSMAYGLLPVNVSETLAARKKSCYEVRGPDIPAMYAMSVRDYDDGLGLLAIGNAFGELALYSITGEISEEFIDLVYPISLPPLSGLDVMPKAHVPARSTMPYPLHPSYGVLVEGFDDIVASWNSCQPETLPRGWEGLDQPWIENFNGMVGGMAWRIEYAWHYLGRQIPIMHRDGEVLLKAGSLFLILDMEYEVISVINPELSLTAILHELSLRPYVPAGSPLYVWITSGENSAHEFGDLMSNFWCEERQKCNRDRLQALRDRGGEVQDEEPQEFLQAEE